MPAGFRQRDPATGVMRFDLNDAGIGRALGQFNVTSSAGSITDNRLLAGKGFVLPTTPYQFSSRRVFTFSGNTLSWTAASAGPSSYFYGVGKANNPSYQSTHVPGTPGFRVRDDAGNFVLDETFFPYHFMGKVSGTFAGGTGPFVVPYQPADLPIFAIKSDQYLIVLTTSTINTGEGAVIVKTPSGVAANLTIYFFGTIDRVPANLRGPIGKRWWINGQLAGDSSVGFLKIVDTFVWGGSDWGGPDRAVAGTKPGRQYALMLHCPGEHYQSFGGQTGPATVSIGIAAGKVLSSGGSDYPYVAEVNLSTNQGGGGPSNQYTDGLYSLVDVTGL